jgi:hypothetical protein
MNFPSGCINVNHLYTTPCPFALTQAVSMSAALKGPSYFHLMPQRIIIVSL